MGRQPEHIVSTMLKIHWIESIRAATHGNGVLHLIFRGNQSTSSISNNESEIVVFTDDPALVGRLVAAINDASTAHEAALSRQPETA